VTKKENHKQVSKRRQKAHKFGYFAEGLAGLYLRLSGYKIIYRNWRSRRGGIDMIAQRGRLIVFVEVKARSDPGQIEDAISSKQWRRIYSAAQDYISQHRALQNCHWRFDAIYISPWSWPRHRRDHWRSDDVF